MTQHPRRALVAAATALLAVVGTAAPAQATYPGDNGRIFFGAFDAGFKSDLWSAQADGSGLEQLTDTPDVVDICPAVSAKGRTLASCRNSGDGYEIWTSNVDGGGDRQLTDLKGWAIFPDWDPLGNRIVFSWAPTPDDHSNLYVVHARSGKVSPLLIEEGWAHENPVFSPDGSKVLYLKMRFDPVEESQLWVLDVQSGETTQLTFDDTFKDQTPDWSPDGERIAYNAITEGNDDIWIMDADGTDQANLTQTADANEFGTSFSPDGRWIAFTGTGGPVPAGERYVQLMRTDGSDRHVLAPTPGLRQAVPAWQPLR